MTGSAKVTWVAILFAASAGFAQTAVTTGGGTTNSIPVFNGGSSIGNSVITQSNGYVGIGTTNPVSPLHLYGSGDQVITLQSATLGFPGIELANTAGQYGYQLDAYNGSLYWWNGSAKNMTLLQNGYLGVGTTNPQAMLDVAGVINGRSFYIPGVATPTWAKVGTFTAVQGGETIRITAFIHAGFNASNSQDSVYYINFKTSNGQSTDANGFAGNGSYYAVGYDSSIPPGNIKWVANTPGTSATSFSLYIALPSWTPGSQYSVSVDQGASWANVGTTTTDPGPASSSVLVPTAGFNIPYGSVGIGTTNPQASLDVNGNIRISGGGAGLTFPDGSVQATAYTGTCTATGGDYAEAVDIQGARSAYEAGDLIVIDPSNPGHFLKSSTPYSRLVAGIYSTKPGYVGRRQTSDPKTASAEIPMAMVGIVPTKVSAENGAIHTGDLLVTSSTAGYAMRGTDLAAVTGAIVGKALGPLERGTGVIEVLVSLQ